MDAVVVHKMNMVRELEKLHRLREHAIAEVNAAMEKGNAIAKKIEELEDALKKFLAPEEDSQKELEEKLLSFI